MLDSIEIVCSFVGALSSFTAKLPLSPLFKLKEEGLVTIFPYTSVDVLMDTGGKGANLPISLTTLGEIYLACPNVFGCVPSLGLT